MLIKQYNGSTCFCFFLRREIQFSVYLCELDVITPYHFSVTINTCSYINRCQAKSRKYQWVFEVKSRVKTWQVRGIWSQQLEHQQVPKWGTEPGVVER